MIAFVARNLKIWLIAKNQEWEKRRKSMVKGVTDTGLCWSITKVHKSLVINANKLRYQLHLMPIPLVFNTNYFLSLFSVQSVSKQLGEKQRWQSSLSLCSPPTDILVNNWEHYNLSQKCKFDYFNLKISKFSQQ